MRQKNLEEVEKQILKKCQRRDRRKKPKMKVSGKEVLKLKKIISAKR